MRSKEIKIDLPSFAYLKKEMPKELEGLDHINDKEPKGIKKGFSEDDYQSIYDSVFGIVDKANKDDVTEPGKFSFIAEKIALLILSLNDREGNHKNKISKSFRNSMKIVKKYLPDKLCGLLYTINERGNPYKHNNKQPKTNQEIRKDLHDGLIEVDEVLRFIWENYLHINVTSKKINAKRKSTRIKTAIIGLGVCIAILILVLIITYILYKPPISFVDIDNAEIGMSCNVTTAYEGSNLEFTCDLSVETENKTLLDHLFKKRKKIKKPIIDFTDDSTISGDIIVEKSGEYETAGSGEYVADIFTVKITNIKGEPGSCGKLEVKNKNDYQVVDWNDDVRTYPIFIKAKDSSAPEVKVKSFSIDRENDCAVFSIYVSDCQYNEFDDGYHLSFYTLTNEGKKEVGGGYSFQQLDNNNYSIYLKNVSERDFDTVSISYEKNSFISKDGCGSDDFESIQYKIK